MVRRSHKQKVEEKRRWREEKKRTLTEEFGVFYPTEESYRGLVDYETAKKVSDICGLNLNVKECRCYAPELDKYNLNHIIK